MAALTRTAQFSRLHKILKRHYSPVVRDPNRSVLEHLLFGCVLENAQYAAAEEAFAALVHTFFDWNEIRVSSIRELSEVMAAVPDPAAAAQRVKRVLQSIFEATYSFDLEGLRKQNLGPAVKRLQEIDGTTPFVVSYVVQTALGGHSIPVDAGTLSVLALVGLISPQDAAAGVVPGLERAIPKSIGIEFGSLLHQLGAAYVACPYSPSLHAVLLEIDPAVKDRLPRRREGKGALVTGLGVSAGPGTEVKPPEPPGRPAAGQRKKAEARREPGQAPQEPAPAGQQPAEPKRPPPASKTRKKGPGEPAPAAAHSLEEQPPLSGSQKTGEQKAPFGGKRQAAAPEKKSPSRKSPDAPKTKQQPGAEEDPSVEGPPKRKPR